MRAVSCAVMFAVLTVSAATAGNSEELSVVAPGTSVEGSSQADWSKLWWQWAASFGRGDNPVADGTGEMCHLKQSGKVWFLAGTYSQEKTVRTCRVPKNQFLFFPLINTVVVPNGETELTCDQARKTAQDNTANPAALRLEIDGRKVKDLKKHRQATVECFDAGTNRRPAQKIFPAAANGYYVMLKPLAPGKHTINFGGQFANATQDIEYTLIVE